MWVVGAQRRLLECVVVKQPISEPIRSSHEILFDLVDEIPDRKFDSQNRCFEKYWNDCHIAREGLVRVSLMTN